MIAALLADRSTIVRKWLGRPEEIAQMAQAIVENAYVNGETIRVGGIRMQPR
jgi:NAD(P)-dependent dehydrogenase (short-subunit alcohol dehydrogenase family)